MTVTDRKRVHPRPAGGHAPAARLPNTHPHTRALTTCAPGGIVVVFRDVAVESNSAGQGDLGKTGTAVDPPALCSVVNFPRRNLAGGRAASRKCSEAGGPASAGAIRGFSRAMPVRRIRGFSTEVDPSNRQTKGGHWQVLPSEADISYDQPTRMVLT